MTRRRTERGTTLFEVVIATMFFTAAIGGLATVTAAHFAFVAGAFERTVAERAAAARLEALAAGGAPLAAGVRPFEPEPWARESLPGARGEERLVEHAPGVFAAEAAVIWRSSRDGEDRRAALATLIAAEVGSR